MVDFTFKGLFMTTNKGIPNLANLSASTTLAKPYYVYSILVQCVLLLFFMLYFALSIFRVYKKIKNNNFEDIVDEEEATNKNQTEKAEGKENENEKEDNLVYKFDDEEEEEEAQKEKERKQDNENSIEKSQKLKKDEEKEKEEAKEEEDYDDYHDQNEQSFIELDKKLLFMQPFLISFIVCNSLFAADPLTIILLVITILSFILINVKKKLENVKIAPFIFMITSLSAFISFFYNDHDLTT